MTKRFISHDDQKAGTGLPDIVETALNNTFGPSRPSLTVNEQAAIYQTTVMIHDASDHYYGQWSRDGASSFLRKSTNRGRTWTTLGPLPASTRTMHKTARGTLLAVELTGTTTPYTTRLWRSADDGATWTLVDTLQYGPLGSSGICETPNGNIGIAEYGNVANTKHRLRVSTDDGLTWSTRLESSGTDPQGDPGHLHSVTYDPIAGKCVVLMDRPYQGVDGATGGPEVWVSDDQMLTWASLGQVGNHGMSADFVTPMYFPTHVAWASDSWKNGYIGRMKRSDFYAGNWDRYETVGRINRTAAYYTFPLRPDVWAVAAASEVVSASTEPDGPGNPQPIVYLVSSDGKVVSGGFSALSTAVIPGEGLIGTPVTFPAPAAGRIDHDGITVFNIPTGFPTGRTAMPVSQGWEPDHQRLGAWQGNVPRLPNGHAVYAYDSAGALRPVVGMNSSDQITLYNELAPVAQRSELRFTPDGSVYVLVGGTTMFVIPPDKKPVLLNEGVRFTSTDVGISVGSGSPEGVKVARPGCLYLDFSGHTPSVWMKERNTNATGWAAIGCSRGTTDQRPAAPPAGFTFFDTTLGKMILWTGTKWVTPTVTDV